MSVNGRTDYFRFHEAFPAPAQAAVIAACYGFTNEEVEQAREAGAAHSPCLQVGGEALPKAEPTGLVLFIEGQPRYLPFAQAFERVPGNPVALVCYSLRKVQPASRTSNLSVAARR